MMIKNTKGPVLVSLLLTAAMLFLCASCSADPSIRRIRQNGGMKIGYVSCAPSEDAPFVMENDTGLTAQPGVKIAKALDTQAAFVRLDTAHAYASLLDGSVDCLWNVVPPSKEQVSSVRTIETGIYYRQVIMTPDGSDITRLADVKGKTMAVVSGSDAQAELHKAAVMEGSLREIKPYGSMTEVMQALASGQADCAAVDEPQALYAASRLDAVFRFIDTPIAESALVIATRAQDADLCANLAERYVKLAQSGEIRTLCEQYAPGGTLHSSMQSNTSEV